MIDIKKDSKLKEKYLIKNMIKQEIVYKNNTNQEIINKIDNLFKKYNLNNKIIDNKYIYYGNNTNKDFAIFANIILYLKDKKWFTENIESWLHYNSDGQDNIEDYSIEDILKHYNI